MDDAWSIEPAFLLLYSAPLVANQKVATKLRKDNPDIKHPYKHKRFFRTHWKTQAIRINGQNIRLSNGKGNKPLKLRLPKAFAGCQPKTVELIWRNGYWLSLTIKVDDNNQPVTGNNVAAIDMFASLTDAWRFAGLTELPVKSMP